MEARVQRAERDGQLRRRVGVRDRAADRPARADLRMPDVAYRLGEERPAAQRPRPSARDRHGARARRSAARRRPRAGRQATPTPFRSTSRVRPREPEVEQRHEALAPGEHLHVLVLTREQREQLVELPRGVVGERRGLHGRPPGGATRASPRVNGGSTCAHAERRQRVGDGVRDRRRRGDGAALPDSLGAERVERRRGLHEAALDGRQLGRGEKASSRRRTPCAAGPPRRAPPPPRGTGRAPAPWRRAPGPRRGAG